MKKRQALKFIMLNACLWLMATTTEAQEGLYSKAYGNPENPGIVFLHGGPGYNAVSFEFTTAQVLADKGFYVVVYDQRGCGRTKTADAPQYTFEEAFNDLLSLYDTYHLKTATLVGHSFGGTLGILFAKQYPEKVSHLVLVGSPLSYQMTFKHIISKSKAIYTESASPQLQYLELLEKMDTASLEYSSYSFMHAMSNGFYRAKSPSEKSKLLNTTLKNHEMAPYLAKMTREPVAGFFANEHYTTLNLQTPLNELKAKTKVYGIYGTEDGLFDSKQLNLLKATLGSEHFTTIENASHSVYIDQQDQFIAQLIAYISK